MGCSGALFALLPFGPFFATIEAVRVPLGAVAGGAGWPAAVVLPWFPSHGPERATQRGCRLRLRPRCRSPLENAPRSLRRSNRPGVLAPAEQAVAGLDVLAVAVRRLGGDGVPGGKGCRYDSGGEGATAGWNGGNRP